MKPWVDQYIPKTISEVIGQDKALAILQQTVLTKKVALLHGSSGVGKTSSVYALARDLGYEILELNASHFRDEGSVDSIVGSSLQQQSLFHKGKIVLVDELEGISGNDDRGGLQALNALLDLKTHAVVLVLNDPWDKKFSTIRKKCVMIEYKEPTNDQIVSVLKRVAENEGITASTENLKTLARRSGGDVRAAINDFQAVCGGQKTFTTEDLEVLGEREQERSIFTLLQIILKGKDNAKVYDAMETIDMDLHEIMLWVDENLGREYKGKDLERGYDVLGKAEVFNGRIRRWQYWRFLVYVRTLMSSGVALAKEKEYYGYTPYKRSELLLKIWMANQKYKRRKDIGKKLAQVTHVSSRFASRYLVPPIQQMYKHDKEIDVKLSDEEVEWLKEK
jgi:replication factor C large subunit